MKSPEQQLPGSQQLLVAQHPPAEIPMIPETIQRRQRWSAAGAILPAIRQERSAETLPAGGAVRLSPERQQQQLSTPGSRSQSMEDRPEAEEQQQLGADHPAAPEQQLEASYPAASELRQGREDPPQPREELAAEQPSDGERRTREREYHTASGRAVKRPGYLRDYTE